MGRTTARGTASRAWNRLARATLLLCLAVLPSGLLAGEARKSIQTLPSLTIGFTAGVFSEVDSNDAKAATKVWADMILRRKGATVDSRTILFKDVAALEAALADKSVDLVFMLPQQFLENRRRLPVVPAVISTPARGGVYEEFLLLVRRDGPGNSLSDLRNRRLNVETDQRGSLPFAWLETLLMKEVGLLDARAFFSNVKVTRKASQTILPVFFRQSDACIVTRNAFEAMVELNPQLGKELLPIAVSPPLVPAIGCVRKDYFEAYYPSLRDDLELLHNDPQGRQILTLFRKGTLTPFKEVHIASVEALLLEHEALQRKIARRP